MIGPIFPPYSDQAKSSTTRLAERLVHNIDGEGFGFHAGNGVHALGDDFGKWKMPIWCALSVDGPTRYNELKRKVGGITNTMLASSLREMEEAGLVVRKQYEEMPVRVEYYLTEKSAMLRPAIEILGKWGQELVRQEQMCRNSSGPEKAAEDG